MWWGDGMVNVERWIRCKGKEEMTLQVGKKFSDKKKGRREGEMGYVGGREGEMGSGYTLQVAMAYKQYQQPFVDRNILQGGSTQVDYNVEGSE